MNLAHDRYMTLKTLTHLTKTIFKIESPNYPRIIYIDVWQEIFFVCTADFSYRPLFHYRFLHHVFSHSFVRFFFHTNWVNIVHTMRSIDSVKH